MNAKSSSSLSRELDSFDLRPDKRSSDVSLLPNKILFLLLLEDDIKYEYLDWSDSPRLWSFYFQWPDPERFLNLIS